MRESRVSMRHWGRRAARVRLRSAYVEMEAPKLLAGKFRLTRRLGAGGTGSVYLARDVRAVKTLVETTVSWRARTEAGGVGHASAPNGRRRRGGRCRGRSSMLRIEERSRGTKSEQLNQASPQASYRPPVVRTPICQPYEGVSSESISCIIHYTKLTPAMVRQQFSHAGGQNDATTREAVDRASPFVLGGQATDVLRGQMKEPPYR